jgi:hypothetical protein
MSSPRPDISGKCLWNPVKDQTSPVDWTCSEIGLTDLTSRTKFNTLLEFGFLTSLLKSLWVLSTLVLSRSLCFIPLYSTVTYTQERNKTHKKAWSCQLDFSLSRFWSLSKLEGINMILTWEILPWVGDNVFFWLILSRLLFLSMSHWFLDSININT